MRGPDLTWIDSLLAVLVLSVALVVVVLLARWAWRNRWREWWLRRHPPPEIPFEVLPEVSVAVANDAPAQFSTLEEGKPS